MTKNLKWWKKAIVYQIYPLSFCDSNGDGYGDINGIISKLDYLKSLGVDVIWLSPIYQSPMDDNGYDISDYDKIDLIFGTKDEFLTLLSEVHQRQMRLIMDLVINHTSDDHRWFSEARKSKSNPYRDYYIWQDEPSDITSVFSGSAWELDPITNQYYFHLFSKKQPDLNWDNPLLRHTIYDMINRWLDLGVDGFRLDVIDLIGKDVAKGLLSDGPYLNKRLKEIKTNCFDGRDILTVGEMPGLSLARARDISHEEEGYLNMLFQFGHVGLDEIPGLGKWALKPLFLPDLKRYYQQSQSLLHEKGWNSLFLANHDQPRAVSRYGNLKFRKESATMLETILYGMQGTPYIYQGEEIGMTGVKFKNIDDYQDVETKNMYIDYLNKGWTHEQIMTSIYAKGRDNSRTPMQWDLTPNAGFTSGKPWLKVNENYLEINVQSDLSNQFSVYQYFQQLIKIRKNYQVFDSGDFHVIDLDNPHHFCYTRKNNDETLLIVGSFSEIPLTIDLSLFENYQPLISNYPTIQPTKQMILPPYYTAVYYHKGKR